MLDAGACPSPFGGTHHFRFALFRNRRYLTGVSTIFLINLRVVDYFLTYPYLQGLADAFILMRYPFDSDAAKKLNIKIFETIYYGALEASSELAEQLGTYETYEGNISGVSNNSTGLGIWDDD